MAHMVSVVVLRCKVGIIRGHYSFPRYTHHSLYSPVTRPVLCGASAGGEYWAPELG